ncbi:MAG: FliI/YscN family ATPase [Pseudomonadota bacterium]
MQDRSPAAVDAVPNLAALGAEVGALRPRRAVGRIASLGKGLVQVSGLAEAAALGDVVRIGAGAAPVGGEIVELHGGGAVILPEGSGEGLRIGDPVLHLGPAALAPHAGWVGRIVDADGRPLDGRPLAPGVIAKPLRHPPPPATERRLLGPRLATGLAVFDTMLPIVRGQRIGVFAGSGVGKSRLMAAFARGMEADLSVIALVGERGREVREFVEAVLGPEGLARSIVVVATSDQPPLVRRRALWSAMAVAEHFRDEGRHVLMLADSVTRFAEAHREVAISAGESAALRGFPASTAHLIMQMAERAGPGPIATGGDITAIFSVLVAGSDMDEPVADILRGVLDGHVVLDRGIAERGRYPAVDVLRSVSRALPDCARAEENTLIALARRRLGAWASAELMVQSGLYTAGSDAEVDAAVDAFPKLDAVFGGTAPQGPDGAFAMLASALGAAAPPRR